MCLYVAGALCGMGCCVFNHFEGEGGSIYEIRLLGGVAG